MLNRILSALTWPGRKLASLERTGRLVGSLLFVDAAGLALCLFMLNGLVFNHALDQDDYSTIIIVPILAYAACLQYGLRSGQSSGRWLGKILLGETVAATILYWVFKSLPMDLSGREILLFFALHLPLHLAGRGLYLLLRKRIPAAPLEMSRLILVAGGSVALISPFVTKALIGSGDAYWYSVVLHDFVAQWRAGIFPVFVGQTPYAFAGTVNPLRFAPYFQHFAGVLDILTLRSLEFVALQNLALVLSFVGGGLVTYFCTVAILPKDRWAAAGLALLYVACPGVLVLAYSGNLFMSVMALPYVPAVVYALWLSLEPDNRTGAVRTALPLAVVWWCHAPVALWLTFLAAGIHVGRLVSRWHDSSVWRDCLKGAAIFASGAGFVFISVATIHPPTEVVDRGLILAGIRIGFPAVLLPVSANGLAHGDTQLGWSLWGVLILAVVGVIGRPRRALGALMAAAALFLLLLLPIPGLNRGLWDMVPQTICNITFGNADQRLYLILAALVAIAGAAAMAGIARRSPKAPVWLTLVLAAGVLWSALEASKFADQVFTFRPAFAQTAMQQTVSNVVLTRYSFGPFATVPSYFSHGYVDPYLENRVLAADQKGVLFDNGDAARPGDATPPVVVRIRKQGGTLVFDPPLALTGGIHYAVRFEPLQPLPPGSLIAEGESAFREYMLPDGGVGMNYTTAGRTFGFLPTSRDFFPLWTSRPGPDEIHLRYVFRDPTAQVDAKRDLVRMRIQPYDVSRLPVKIERWAPYQASLDSPAAGAWLETPRLFIKGYRATVNGQRVAIRRSADGRVLVPLAAGSNRIVLSYSGPVLLLASYYLALVTGILLGGRALRGLIIGETRISL